MHDFYSDTKTKPTAAMRQAESLKKAALAARTGGDWTRAAELLRKARALTGDSDPLELDAKSVLWVHGLFGDSQPDVAKMVADAAQGAGDRAGHAGLAGAGGPWKHSTVPRDPPPRCCTARNSAGF